MKYIILGGVQPALELTRVLARARYEVYIVCRSGEVAKYSRYGHKIIVPENVELAAEQLLLLYAQLEKGSEEVAVIPASEFFLEVSQQAHPPHSFRYFGVAYFDVDDIRNKMKAYTIAAALGVKVPYWAPLKNLQLCESEMIAKWGIANSAPSKLNKTWQVTSVQELQRLKACIPEDCQVNIVVQDKIVGRSISYGSVWLDGRPCYEVVVHQVRQYPMGITSAVEEVEYDLACSVKSIVQCLSHRMNFNGFVEVEFIEADGECYMIDINPRLWGWSKALLLKYPYLYEVIADGHRGNDEMRAGDNEIAWVNVLRDIPAILNSSNVGENKLSLVFQSLFSPKYSRNSFCLRDPLPEIMGVLK